MSAAALAAPWMSAECGAPGPLATSQCIVATGHIERRGELLPQARGFSVPAAVTQRLPPAKRVT